MCNRSHYHLEDPLSRKVVSGSFTRVRTANVIFYFFYDASLMIDIQKSYEDKHWAVPLLMLSTCFASKTDEHSIQTNSESSEFSKTQDTVLLDTFDTIDCHELDFSRSCFVY